VKSLIANDCRIKFIGWLNREDTLSILKYSDVGVWNTQHTTLLEDCIAVDLPMILRYYGNTCHLIDNTGLYLYEGTIREIEDKISFLINNRDIVKVFKENIPYIRKLLSYDNIANESIEYSKNLNYLETHKKFMSLKYFDKNYKYLKRINRN
jgi:glycosyltransferase involved in cell wall biosynthesis